MSQTNQTSGTNSSSLGYNPAAQYAYNNMIGGAGGVLGNYISNPLSGPAFNLGAGQAQAGAQAGGQGIMQALSANQQNSGISGQAGAGFLGAQRAGVGRAVSSGSSQANLGNVQQGFGRQMSAIGTGMSFAPQLMGQTGSFNQTTGMKGFGSWGTPLMTSILAWLGNKYAGGGGGGSQGGGG